MRLDSLTHKEIPADSILKEIGVPKGERQVIMEFLPLIPVALWAGGAAWTAYDTYQAKKAYDRGEITQAELATRVGTDVAIGIAGGVLGKAVGAGWKVGKRIFRNKKAAQAAQKQTADIPTPSNVTAPTGINTVANATTTTTKTSSKKAVQTAKPGDTIKTDKGEFLAGVDGKATTTRVNAPNASAVKDQILKIANPDSSTAAAVVSKTDDVASTVATQTAKATDDAAEIAAKRADAIAGGPDFARNYVKNRALTQMKDLPVAGQKSFVQSIEKAHPGIAKELGVDNLLAPAASTATRTVTKTTGTGLTRAQRNAISNMDDVPTSSATRNTATGTAAKKADDVAAPVASTGASVTSKTGTGLTRAQRNAISKMDDTPTVRKSTATGSATSTAAKQADDAAAAARKRADNKPKKNKKDDGKNGGAGKKRRWKGFFSNLNRGDYWDTDLSSVAQKYGSF